MVEAVEDADVAERRHDRQTEDEKLERHPGQRVEHFVPAPSVPWDDQRSGSIGKKPQRVNAIHQAPE